MFKKIISFIYPFARTENSLHNGLLTIVLINGKKLLNTKNANYSFGSLHRIMRFAFRKALFQGNDDILLLGLGAGSVISIIRGDLKLENKIIAVDFDPVIINIAKKEFSMESYADTEIVCRDAYDFVQDSKEKYGLIIVDLFINNEVPAKFYDSLFWENTLRILTPSGRIIFNTMIKTTRPENLTKLTGKLESTGFSYEVYDKVDRTNLLIIAKRR